MAVRGYKPVVCRNKTGVEIALGSGGEIGKHAAFRALWAQALGSSSLPSSTILILINLKT